MAELKQNDWRRKLLPAYYRNDGSGVSALFHVETNSRASGRRTVVHEFPKKDLPYTEDMGRKAIEFTVRGYFVAYPKVGGDAANQQRPNLYREDYTIARDALIDQLEREGSGVLQLPSLAPMRVVCQSYRLTEEQRLGGYATIDMSFVEQGKPPFEEIVDDTAELIKMSQTLKQWIVNRLDGSYSDSRKLAQKVVAERRAIPRVQKDLSYLEWRGSGMRPAQETYPKRSERGKIGIAWWLRPGQESYERREDISQPLRPDQATYQTPEERGSMWADAIRSKEIDQGKWTGGPRPQLYPAWAVEPSWTSRPAYETTVWYGRQGYDVQGRESWEGTEWWR